MVIFFSEIALESQELWQAAYAKIHTNKGAMTRGVDGTTMDGYSEERVANMIALLKDGRYAFKPVRRVYIPKANGKRRPLGLPMCPAYCLSFQDGWE